MTGNLETMTEPESLVTQYQMYNAQGLSEKVLDPNNVATDYAYDDVGRVQTATVAGDTTGYVYTGSGKLSSVTLPKSALHEMEYFYDGLDRLEFLEDGLGNRIQYTYDSAGNRRREDFRDGVGTIRKTTSFEYDVLHRLKKVKFSDGTFREYGYDARGNRTSEKDPNNNPATTSEYDSLGRLERTVQKVTSPSLGLHDVVTQYGYDEHDNLISVTDANLLQTTYVYDDMGRVYQEISPDTGTTTFLYDEAGNVVSKTDARGIQVGYQYDGLNRILFTDFPTDPDITYVYDASTSCAYGKTRLCFVQDQSGTTEYAYTAKGELETEERYVNAVAQSFTTGYLYDPNGNLETLTYPSGRTVTYSYDLADQVTTVTTIPSGGGQQTVAYGVEYEPFGPLKKLVHGNELIREVGFDDQYRVRSIRTADVGLTNVIQDLTYTPDFNGNILGIADNDDPTKSKTFGYDEMDRLTSATGPYGPSGAQAPLGWTYDDVGNRLSYDAPEGTTSYQYLSGTNRIEASSGANNASFTYLPNGALQVAGPLGLGFGDGNRLTSIDDPGLVANYWYSFDGARVNKTTPDMSTTFVYDSEHDLMSEISGPQLLEHVNLNSDLVGIGIGQELALVHADHLGTPMFGTNSAATAVWTYESRPFGDVETTSMTGSIVVHRRQPGHYRDEETAMNYNYYRYYVSEMGRYARPDPIGASFGFGLYPYVINNPMRYIDPFGLAPFKDCPPRQNSFDGTRPGPGLPPEGLQDDPSATAKPKSFWSLKPAPPPKYAYPTKWDQNINLSCEDEFGGGWELIGHNVFCQGGMLLNPNSRTKAWASWVKNWIRICEEYVPGAKETCKGMNDLATGTIGRCICCQRKCE